MSTSEVGGRSRLIRASIINVTRRSGRAADAASAVVVLALVGAFAGTLTNNWRLVGWVLAGVLLSHGFVTMQRIAARREARRWLKQLSPIQQFRLLEQLAFDPDEEVREVAKPLTRELLRHREVVPAPQRCSRGDELSPAGDGLEPVPPQYP